MPWTEIDCKSLERVQRRAVGMISGLHQKDYEGKLKEIGLTLLKEQRHCTNMQMVQKRLKGENRLDPEVWFECAVDSGRATRITADPLNINPGLGRLELRQNFLTLRVNEWNRIPAEIAQQPSAAYTKQREMTHPAA